MNSPQQRNFQATKIRIDVQSPIVGVATYEKRRLRPWIKEFVCACFHELAEPLCRHRMQLEEFGVSRR
jgi:hypothetical protein